MCSCRTARTFSAARNEHSAPDKKLSTSSLGFYFEECCIGWSRGFSRENRSACMPFWFGSIAATARLMKGGVAYSQISSQLPPSTQCFQFSATLEISVWCFLCRWILGAEDFIYWHQTSVAFMVASYIFTVVPTFLYCAWFWFCVFFCDQINNWAL